jgi:hypothetical protein
MLAVAEIGATGFLTPRGCQRPLLFVACRQNKKCPQEIFAGVWATALYRRAMVQVRQKLHNHAEIVIRTCTNAVTATGYSDCRAIPGTITLKLALRAQSQGRVTWEALATIKNPAMVGYGKQTNIAHGHQQVNTASSSPSEAPRTRKKQNSQNKLLEEKDGERLDIRATSEAGGAYPAMETVGEIDRAENTGGYRHGFP